MDFLRRLSRLSPRPSVIVCSGAFTEAERPHIPGVHLAAKTPDLKELWAALRAATPAATVAAVPARAAVAAEDGVWRD